MVIIRRISFFIFFLSHNNLFRFIFNVVFIILIIHTDFIELIHLRIWITIIIVIIVIISIIIILIISIVDVWVFFFIIFIFLSSSSSHQNPFARFSNKSLIVVDILLFLIVFSASCTCISWRLRMWHKLITFGNTIFFWNTAASSLWYCLPFFCLFIDSSFRRLIVFFFLFIEIFFYFFFSFIHLGVKLQDIHDLIQIINHAKYTTGFGFFAVGFYTTL